MKRFTQYSSRIAAALGVSIAALTTLATSVASAADAPPCRHAVSLVDAPKMPPDFKHFDWVNPDAPKGGTLKIAEVGTFDSFNMFTIEGQAADGLGGIFDSLFVASPDEPSTAYGLIAECVSYPDDFASATFKLRPEAKFQDGKPVRPEDVAFSLEAMKSANPQMALYYKNVVKAEKTGEHEVTFTFDVKGNRELPHILSDLNVLPEHYWKANGANGAARDIKKSTLEAPLGSGPFKIKSFEVGRSVIYARDPDYWAKDLPVNKGQWNFDEVRHEYFRDRVPAFEAFKSGVVDVWLESSSNAWASQYDFDAVKNGHIKKELLPHQRVAGMQSFTFNLRRKQFSDVRVRQALGLVMDFEELNKKIFAGAYTRLNSYFDNSELRARGLPEGRELEILNEVKADVPADVFTTEFQVPVNATADDLRNRMRDAVNLLKTAGWTLKGGSLTNAAGETLNVEFLLVQQDFERVVLPYIENLKKIGVNATVRIIDSSAYERRFKSFDYDVVVNSIGQSHSPGNEQRFFFGSEAAGRQGSRNAGGIKNPAIDKLIEKIVMAKDRADLVAATHALDRVLLWNFYVVPNWYLPADRVASWAIFGRPAKLPSQAPVRHEQTWWVDAAKAKAIEAVKAK